jgi:aspartyl-tRNA(Asn)/glutamyl-tRNA(Gln) amidotransferase subunit A
VIAYPGGVPRPVNGAGGTPPSLAELTLSQAAAALLAGECSSVELTDDYLIRIDELNPSLNAYVEVTRQRAKDDAARAADEIAKGQYRGPLHGIPIALKDLIDTGGIRTGSGTAVYRDRVPARDATVARRLAHAGAVLLGKTNLHELAFGVTTDNPHTGTTRNPHDPSRIPGGSSGGSGAAVAAHLAAAALGTDSAVSIRGPASFCGCVGLKPTYGLVPKSGVTVLSQIGDHVGPLARTVEDVALVLQAIAGYDAADFSSVPVPVPDYRAALTHAVGGLKAGIPRSTMWGLLDDEVRAAADAALIVLADLGATLVDIDLPDHLPAIGQPGTAGYFSLGLTESKFAHREAWAAHPEMFGPDLATLYSLPEMTGPMVAESLDMVYVYAQAVRQALTEVDVLASPTVPIAAPEIGAEMVTVGGQELPLSAVAIANTAPYNMARVPAISVPCGTTSAGLPIGFQIAGRPFDEATVLRAAHAYEQAVVMG